MRPLLAKRETINAASAWHRAVFKAHGSCCHFCGKKGSTDAMHVIPRSRIGPKARYACPVENGRPGCRACHDAQERGEKQFPIAVRRRAIRALNKILKAPIMEPV